VAGPHPQPTDEDGPLFRGAYRHADAVDRARTPNERRAAWGGFLPRALVALVEGFVRDALVTGAVVFSLIVVVMAATSGDAAWAAGGVVCGLVGVGLVLVAKVRHWSFGWQWAVIGFVLLTQAAFMILFWRFH
jgi:hypothetical protein